MIKLAKRRKSRFVRRARVSRKSYKKARSFRRKSRSSGGKLGIKDLAVPFVWGSARQFVSGKMRDNMPKIPVVGGWFNSLIANYGDEAGILATAFVLDRYGSKIPLIKNLVGGKSRKYLREIAKAEAFRFGEQKGSQWVGGLTGMVGGTNGSSTVVYG